MPRQTLTQRPDGRFRCKFKGQEFYGSSQKEALAKREEYKKQLALGEQLRERGILTGTYCLRWLKTYKSQVTPAVKADYQRHIRRFCTFAPDGAQLGDLPLKDLTASDIKAYFDSLAGLSFSSVRGYTGTVRAVFRAALADRVILHNPAQAIAAPRAHKGSHRALEPWEMELIRTVPHRAQLAALVMLYAGLRRGEVLALDIDRDVDFQRGLLHVREAVRFVGQHRPELVDPKTEAGARTIPLFKPLADALRGHHGRVLSSASGQLMTQSAWKRCWASYMNALAEARNGSTRRWHQGEWHPVDIRAHDLRHTFCTLLYNAGVDVKTAQRWMGHADAQVTMQIYTHLTADRAAASTAAMDSYLSGGQNGGQEKSAAPLSRAI